MRIAWRTLVLFAASCATSDAVVTPDAPRHPPAFASGSRLLAQAWDIEGTLVLRHFFDVERGEACAFEGDVQHVGPGRSRYCLPLDMARHDPDAGPFADEACTVPLALSPPSGPATYALETALDACAAPPRVHRVGPAETKRQWVKDGGRCAPSAIAITTQPFVELVPLESFVRGEETVEDRGSRVASLVVVTADGARQTIGGFDVVRQEPVRIEARPSSFPRWAPSRVAFQGAGTVRYSDGACTAAVPTKVARDAACPLTAVFRFEGECGGGRYHAIGPPLDAATLFELDDDGACVRAAPSSLFAFEVGAPITDVELAPAYVSDVGPGPIRRRGFAGPGGAVAAWGDVMDDRIGAACAPALAIDGVQRCLPAPAASLGAFADPACTAPAIAEPITACPSESGRFLRVPTEAGARVFERVGYVSTLYAGTPESCSPFEPPVPSRGYAVQEVDVGMFVVVDEVEVGP